ncbi:MAG: IS5 family transposase [Gemmatimonadota bacterium]|nr:IS5 family transposase [Gemmatimonadota bacterium]
MSEQTTFAGLAWSLKGKVTRRERFLAEMNAVIPWARLLALIAPHYPVAGRGRQPLGLEKMLRIYFLQQWFDLSDPAAEDAIYDSESMRRFSGVELGVDPVPDESTILRFRHLLEEHELTVALFAEVGTLLQERGLLLRQGTIVDATIIAAPSSTKNAAQRRDPEMKQTRKGNTWHFGMKIHVGTDRRGVVHSLTTTDAAVGDITQMPALLHGRETEVFGDRAYWSEGDRVELERLGVRYRVNRRGAHDAPVSARWRAINRIRSRVRARGEHAFHVVKRLWGFQKVRYRGLLKNTVRAYAAFALANLYLVRHQLLPAEVSCAL